MGAVLYWAEGSKTNMFALTNSDPILIAFFVEWVYIVFGMRPGLLKAWMNIYPQQNEGDLKNFWSDITGIPVENFGKSYIKPPGTGFKKNNLYYGTVKVSVPKSVDMRHKVFGWIQGAVVNPARNVDFVRKKWHHLTEVDRAVNL